ncbi:MAG: sigma-70 family RNA polymerase sigma factor [Vicinamibacteria bacterium]
MMSQADLARNVARVRAGETDAWGQLYEELAPSVFRLCRRVLPTREDTEDATTEIFLKVRLRLDQYDSSRPFRPWLYKLASNHCWDELRKRQVRGETEAGDLDALQAESSGQAQQGPLASLLAQQDRKDIRRAVAKLADRDRLAIAMRYFAELSYQEIADVLGMNSSAVGVLLLRARRRLRQTLVEEGKA